MSRYRKIEGDFRVDIIVLFFVLFFINSQSKDRNPTVFFFFYRKQYRKCRDKENGLMPSTQILIFSSSYAYSFETAE